MPKPTQSGLSVACRTERQSVLQFGRQLRARPGDAGAGDAVDEPGRVVRRCARCARAWRSGRPERWSPGRARRPPRFQCSASSGGRSVRIAPSAPASRGVLGEALQAVAAGPGCTRSSGPAAPRVSSRMSAHHLQDRVGVTPRSSARCEDAWMLGPSAERVGVGDAEFDDVRARLGQGGDQSRRALQRRIARRDEGDRGAFVRRLAAGETSGQGGVTWAYSSPRSAPRPSPRPCRRARTGRR